MKASLILLLAISIRANALTNIKEEETSKAAYELLYSGHVSRPFAFHPRTDRLARPYRARQTVVPLETLAWTTFSYDAMNVANTEVEGIACYVEKGVDLPGSTIKSFKDGACSCCFHCNAEPNCRAWVYNEATEICELKSRSFAQSEKERCPECMASDRRGARYFVCKRWIEIVSGESTIPSDGVRWVPTKTERVEPGTLVGSSSDVFVAAHRGRESEELEKSVSPVLKSVATGSRVKLEPFFGSSGWSSSRGHDECTVDVGYDQPHEFDFPNMPLYAEEAFHCCDFCSHHKQCQSWVWHSQTGECYLKRSYNSRAAKMTPCGDCVAYSVGGEYCVYASDSEDSRSEEAGIVEDPEVAPTKKRAVEAFWEQEEGFTYGIVGSETSDTPPRGDAKTPQTWRNCLCSAGFDQPAEFNLLTRPLLFDTAKFCCEACRRNDLCASWVWKSRSRECYLKGDYDAELNTMVCEDCIGSSMTAEV